MSRRIDVSDPENMSDEDKQYLAERGRTVEQERASQQEADRIAGVVEHDEGQVPARVDYIRRNGGPVFGDPALGRLRSLRRSDGPHPSRR